MRFLFENSTLSSEEFARRFPLEWKALAHFQGDADILVEGDQIALVNEVGSPLFIDIENKLAYHKRFFHKNSKYTQPLAKAIGLKRGKKNYKVVDATGGMLGDTLLMLAMDVDVWTIERHPLIAALAINALRKVGRDDKLLWGNCLEFPEQLGQSDCVFFDPMFQDPNDKTAPKKAMQVFRTYVGPDLDAKEIAIKLRTKAKRLVVKRPIKAPMLLEKPTMTFKGKSTAYDVYLEN